MSEPDFANMSDDQAREMMRYEQTRSDAIAASKNMWTQRCVRCSFGHTPMEARPAFACRHVCNLDTEKPEGIVFLPEKFFMCFKCLNLYEARRFDLKNELVLKCCACVMEEIQRVKLINPFLFKDLNANPMG